MASIQSTVQSSRTTRNCRKGLSPSLWNAFVVCLWSARSETRRCQKHSLGRAWCKRPVHGQISRKPLATARLAESSPWSSCRSRGQGSPWPLPAVVSEAQVSPAQGLFRCLRRRPNVHTPSFGSFCVCSLLLAATSSRCPHAASSSQLQAVRCCWVRRGSGSSSCPHKCFLDGLA